MQEEIPENIDLHGYADDHALKTRFVPTQNEAMAIATLEKCTRQIKVWMDSNKLKMNTSKTEFILFGANKQLKKCLTTNLSVDNEAIDKTSQIKYLGACLDESLNFKDQIKNKCKSAMWNLQRIKSIRSILTKEACKTLVMGLIISQLDYANCLYIGQSECDVKKLQRIQNIAAKIVLKRVEIQSHA